jgi:hypothetical protein
VEEEEARTTTRTIYTTQRFFQGSGKKRKANQS